MNSGSAAAVCVITSDAMAFLDRIDRVEVGLEHPWDYFCEDGGCPGCDIENQCQRVAMLFEHVDRNNPEHVKRAYDLCEMIFEVHEGMV